MRKRKLEDLPELPSPMKYFYSKKNKLCIAAQKKCGKKMMRHQLQIEQMLDDYSGDESAAMDKICEKFPRDFNATIERKQNGETDFAEEPDDSADE